MCAAEGPGCSPLAKIGQGQSDRGKANDANHRQQRGHFRDRHRDIANVVNLRAGLVARILGCFGRKFTARRQIRVRDSREYPQRLRSDQGAAGIGPGEIEQVWIIDWRHFAGSGSDQRRAKRPACRLGISPWHVSGEIVNREKVVPQYILVLGQGRTVIPIKVYRARRCNVSCGGDGRNNVGPSCQRENRSRKEP